MSSKERRALSEPFFCPINELLIRTIDRFAQWDQLPLGLDLLPDEQEKAMRLTNCKNYGLLQRQLGNYCDVINDFLIANRYLDAYFFITSEYERINQTVEGEALLALERLTLKNLGYIFEYRVTHGDFSGNEADQNVVTAHFLNAALYYMEADIQLGCASPLIGRIHECMAGADLTDLCDIALAKLFGGKMPDDVIFINNRAVFDDWRRRAMSRGMDPQESKGVFFMYGSDFPERSSN